MKVIIIDDEKMARSLLAEMLNELNLKLEIVAQCEDLASGVKAIRKHKPSLVLLDIEMPGHSGLELLDFFEKDEITFSIIFTTAYNQYAIHAFKLSAIDYLLKPIEINDLSCAIQKYLEGPRSSKTYQLLRENLQNTSIKKIAVNTLNSTKFIELNDIVYLKANGAYTEFILNSQSVIMSSKGLKFFEDILIEQQEFLRCHKSYICNLNYVKELLRSGGGSLIMKNGDEISISSEKTEEFLIKMSAY